MRYISRLAPFRIIVKGVADSGFGTLIIQEPSFRRAKLGYAQEQPWAPQARLVLDTAPLVDDEQHAPCSSRLPTVSW